MAITVITSRQTRQLLLRIMVCYIGDIGGETEFVPVPTLRVRSGLRLRIVENEVVESLKRICAKLVVNCHDEYSKVPRPRECRKKNNWTVYLHPDERELERKAKANLVNWLTSELPELRRKDATMVVEMAIYYVVLR